MKYKLVQYKENIYAAFWIAPLIISLIAILLAAYTLYLDHTFTHKYLEKYINYFINPSSSRQVLAVIATAAITITSVTFSITVLILSMASNQLGPRLLPNFMRQKSTQFVLGFFIGTFIYSLIILQAMSFFNLTTNIPFLSVTVGLLLGILAFLLLIYFIHFICHVIQIDNVLTLLVDDLIQSIERQFPDVETQKNKAVHEIVSDQEKYIEKISQTKTCSEITSPTSGYLQTINFNELLRIAIKNDLIIKVHLTPGKFIFTGLAVISIYSNKAISDQIKSHCLKALQIGKRRSTIQDIEFAFEEIAEIGLIALSSGVNNPYTAIHCMDRMVQGFANLAKKRMHSHIICDDHSNLRIIRAVVKHKDIVRTALNRFRQQEQYDLSVSIHTLIMIRKLLKLKMPSDFRQALTEQANLVYTDASTNKMNSKDREDLDYFYERLNKEHL